ncbi:MAG: pyridoxine 5'-phosphate synthase [Pseudomonadota bacterium]
MTDHLRLGVNIDHVATIRNARGGAHPDPARAAELAQKAGADGITIHLREDRRHIRDDDLARIRAATDLPINLEMAVTDEMIVIGERFKPHAACFVPEKREERTTEGGLNVAGLHNCVAPAVARMREAGSRVSLFIEPDPVQIAVAEVLGAPVVELHTGRYAELWLDGDKAGVEAELERLCIAAAEAAKRGIEPHAGHGLTYDNVGPVAAIPELAELNIGHFLIGEAIFDGLENAITQMRRLMDEARAGADKP